MQCMWESIGEKSHDTRGGRGKERIRDTFHDLSRTNKKTFLLLYIYIYVYDIQYKNAFLLATSNPSEFKVLNLIISNANNVFNAYL